MLYVILSIFLFFLTVVLHIFLHRFLMGRGVVSYKSIYLFGFGAIFTFLTLLFISLSVPQTSWWSVSFVFSSTLIFGLLSFLYYIYFGNAYLGEDSPSSRIFYHLEHGPKSYEQILSYFSDEAIVGKRMRNLVDARLVKKEDERYIVTGQGKFLIRIVEFYRLIMHWNKGG